MILESIVGALGAVIATIAGTGTRQGREFDKRLTIIEKTTSSIVNCGDRLIAVETKQKDFDSWLSRVETKLDRVIESRHA